VSAASRHGLLARRDLLIAAAASLGCGTTGGTFSEAGPSQVTDLTTRADGPTSIKVLTWNIFMMPCWVNESPDNETRARAIAAELKARDFDVLCLQKVFDTSARAALEEELAPHYPYRFGPANGSRWSFKINSGVWVLSRLPLTDYREIQFSECGGIECFSRKGALRLRGTLKGEPFFLVATHLQGEEGLSFTIANQRIRNAQMTEIRDAFIRPAEQETPFVMCGDFGTPRFDAQLVHETDDYFGMLATFGAENGRDLRITLDDSRVDNDLATDNTGRKNELDYILLRNWGPDVQVQRERHIFQRQGWDTSSADRKDLSYRYAVSATIALGGTPDVGTARPTP
jgi:endonuclease/exonuclease/phosphatase family metal-dependent hydrolase